MQHYENLSLIMGTGGTRPGNAVRKDNFLNTITITTISSSYNPPQASRPSKLSCRGTYGILVQLCALLGYRNSIQQIRLKSAANSVLTTDFLCIYY